MKVTFIFLFILASVDGDAANVRYFSEYMFFRNALTHDKALAVCQLHNSVLAMPKTPKEYADILATVGETKMDFWLGLKRDSGEEFKYANGETLVYQGWKENEPNSGQGCVEGLPWVVDEYTWVDQNCAVLNSYVCQFGIGFGVTYEAFGDKMKYIDAVKSCRKKGGDIAMPKTHEEGRHISDAYKILGTDSAYWVGVHKDMENWRWEDGQVQTFSYNSWHSEFPFVQPDNFLGGPENCAQYNLAFDNWNDCLCDLKMAYVCQKTREYRAYTKPMTWENAVAACESNNTILVMPKTALEYEHVLDTAELYNIRSFWLGLRRGDGLEFKYTNGGSLTYQGWYPDGEDSRGVDEGCVEGWPWLNGQWHEQNCVAKLHYVCQFANGVVTYKAFNKNLKYIDAVKSCREKGGDIAMPTSFEEDQKILEAAKLVDTGEYWIGVQAVMEHWFWLDGEEQTFSFDSWHYNQPDNFKGREENCAHYKKFYKNWNDIKCSRKFPFICQRYVLTTTT